MRLLILLLSVLLVRCSDPDKLPKDVLPPQKMEPLLWDMIVADEAAGYYAPGDSALTAFTRHIDNYNKVLAIHQTSKEVLKTSLFFYQRRPDLLKPILDSMQRKSERLHKSEPKEGVVDQ